MITLQKMPKKKKSKPIEDGIEFDSQEEVQFYYWLQELWSAGYIQWFEKVTDSIEICPKITTSATKSGKTKEKTVFRPLTYTPDFKIKWHRKAIGLFSDRHLSSDLIFIDDWQESIIDVKGKFAGVYNNSGLTFPIIQKVLYNFRGIYIQKIIPEDLFKMTFLPEKLFKTKTGKDKSWKFPKTTLEEYLKNAN